MWNDINTTPPPSEVVPLFFCGPDEHPDSKHEMGLALGYVYFGQPQIHITIIGKELFVTHWMLASDLLSLPGLSFGETLAEIALLYGRVASWTDSLQDEVVTMNKEIVTGLHLKRDEKLLLSLINTSLLVMSLANKMIPGIAAVEKRIIKDAEDDT